MYVPGGFTWYDWYTGQAIPSSTSGRYVTVSAPIDIIPIHIKSGSIIPIQKSALTTVGSRATPFTIIVANNPTAVAGSTVATGKVFLDDGISLDPSKAGYAVVYYSAKSDGRAGFKLTNAIEGGYGSFTLGDVVVYGLPCTNVLAYDGGVQLPTLVDGGKVIVTLNTSIYKSLDVSILCANTNNDSADGAINIAE